MGSLTRPPAAKCRRTSQRLPLAVLSMSVGLAVSGVVFSPTPSTSRGAASDEGLRAETAMPGAPGARGGAGCLAAVARQAAYGGPAGRGDPPPPELPNKFEFARFEAPAYPDYALAETARIGTEAIGADGPAPRMPATTTETAERQILEESRSLSDTDPVSEAAAAEACE